MYKTTTGVPTPTANIAINKSRIKLYGKKSKVPTYYLKKGQEFEIELFNPTKDTIMAKIHLNGKPIAQGGLVLKPGVRVFLDRYIDVARKFKFDTYEVGNSSEVKKAIEDNGDFKVEFYKAQTLTERLNKADTYFRNGSVFDSGYTRSTNYGIGLTNIGDDYGARGMLGITNTTSTDANLKGSLSDEQSVRCNYSADITPMDGSPCLDMLDFGPTELKRQVEPRKRVKAKRSKTIETGRVEEGSQSDQTLDIVYMNWESYPFHTIEYKMLPVSQKVNTVQDVRVKRYCTSCGTKQKPNFKFCPSCGARV